VHDWTAHNELALSGEMLYVWLGLYATYFFSPAPPRLSSG
jgi:hypothetical protein